MTTPSGPDPFGVESWYRDEAPPSTAVPTDDVASAVPVGGVRPARARADDAPRPTLALVALALALLATLAVGLAAHGLPASLDLMASEPLTGPRRWALVAVVGTVLGAVGLALGIAAAFRSHRLLAALAIVAALVLPPTAVSFGLQTGVTAMKVHLARDAGGAAVGAVGSVRDVMAGIGPLGDRLGAWLEEQAGS